MTLKFALPPLSGPVAANIDPAEIERRIADLPVLNAAESSHQLFSTLSQLNRQPLDDKVRLQLLELYRRPVHFVCAEQQKRYLGLPIPLPRDSRMVAERVHQFQTEMAYGYKRLVIGFREAGGREPETVSAAALATQRSIRYLTLVLARSYELYAPVPEGTWREIHQLYRYAETEGFTEVAVADELNAAVAHSSVGHAYKQALLLGFSDPYHLPAQLLPKIDRYLDAYAPLAQITPVTVALNPECQFLVDLENDRAGVANTDSLQVTAESRYRLLSTLGLARAMHQQLSGLRNGQQPPPDTLGKDFYANRGEDMLARLITSWGVNPRRYFPRTPKDGTEAEVVRGIDDINFCVNGGQTFTLSTAEVGPQPVRREISGQNPESGIPADRRTISIEPWNLLEESAGGFSLMSTNTNIRHIHVGDLIAVRMAGHQTAGWGIAVVRWVQSPGSDQVEIGVQRLAPTAKPGAVAVNGASGNSFAIALRLPELRLLRQPETLITPCGSFKPRGILILDDGYRTYQIRPVRLVNLTGSFEQFEFAFLD